LPAPTNHGSDAETKTPPPCFLQIEPVGQCNLRCPMCPILFRQDGPPFGPLAIVDYDSFVTLLDQLPGVPELHLQGLGEPLMHPRLFDMVREAAGRGIRVTTNTNLTLLNPRRAALCIASGLHTLNVSIDGATRETYEAIRVRGRWDGLLNNLESFRTARSRLRSPLPHLRLVMVLMRRNLRELPDLIRFAHANGFEEMFVQQLCHDFAESTLPEKYRPMREFVNIESLNSHKTENTLEIFEESRVIARALGLTLRLPSLDRREHDATVPGRSRCDWPWRGAYVSYQGFAMPCCMVSTPDRIHFGNVFQDGFDSVWNGPAYRRFRDQLDSAAPPPVCASCSVYRGTF
jgi:MoaA/NifB/PqqE/SkfB family radical SAM enzyme